MSKANEAVTRIDGLAAALLKEAVEPGAFWNAPPKKQPKIPRNRNRVAIKEKADMEKEDVGAAIDVLVKAGLSSKQLPTPTLPELVEQYSVLQKADQAADVQAAKAAESTKLAAEMEIDRRRKLAVAVMALQSFIKATQNFSRKDLAAKLGVSTETIRKHLLLAENYAYVGDKYQEMLNTGKLLSLGQAVALSKFREDDRRNAILEVIEMEGNPREAYLANPVEIEKAAKERNDDLTDRALAKSGKPNATPTRQVADAKDHQNENPRTDLAKARGKSHLIVKLNMNKKIAYCPCCECWYPFKTIQINEPAIEKGTTSKGNAAAENRNEVA